MWLETWSSILTNDECNAADGHLPTGSTAHEKLMERTTMDREGYYREVKEVVLEGFKRINGTTAEHG